MAGDCLDAQIHLRGGKLQLNFHDDSKVEAINSVALIIMHKVSTWKASSRMLWTSKLSSRVRVLQAAFLIIQSTALFSHPTSDMLSSCLFSASANTVGETFEAIH